MGFGLALALVAQPLSSTAKGDESLCNSDSETRHFSVAEGHLQVTKKTNNNNSNNNTSSNNTNNRSTTSNHNTNTNSLIFEALSGFSMSTARSISERQQVDLAFVNDPLAHIQGLPSLLVWREILGHIVVAS